MSNEKIRVAGEYIIEKCVIVSTNDRKLSVTPQLKGLYVFEDVYSPFITGKLVLDDSVDLTNHFPFCGQEFIDIKFRTPTFTKNEGIYDQRFYIYRFSDREKVNMARSVYVLYFISVDSLANNDARYSRKFKDECSKMVNFQYKTFKSKKPLYVEQTTSNISYISNYWSPVENINYIQQKSKSKSGSWSYVFYEDRDRYNFLPLDSLLKQSPYIKFTYDPHGRESFGGSVDEDFRKVLDVVYTKEFDTIESAKQGTYYSSRFHYDPTYKTYTIVGFDWYKDYKTRNHLNPHDLNNDKVPFNSHIKQFRTLVPSHTFKNENVELPNVQKRNSELGMLNTRDFSIQVLGRTDYKVGMVVELSLPAEKPLKQSDAKEKHKDFINSGRYLVTALSHIIDTEKHLCVLELSKESHTIPLED